MKGNHNRKFHALIDRARELVEVHQMQQHKAAELLGVDRTTIGRWCKRFGIATQKTGPRPGELHPGWSGGMRIVKGYRYIYCPNHPNTTKQKYVAEHRLVMESVLGRYLEKHEVVHHIDGNPLNNNPSNLVVFGSNADHLRHELTGKVPNWTDHGKQRMKDCASKPRGYRPASERKIAELRSRVRGSDGRFLPRTPK